LFCFFVFFFQAEDGIRDFHVTGVQTCALPILRSAEAASAAILEGGMAEAVVSRPFLRILQAVIGFVDRLEAGLGILAARIAVRKIGRASCRERVWSGGVAV